MYNKNILFPLIIHRTNFWRGKINKNYFSTTIFIHVPDILSKILSFKYLLLMFVLIFVKKIPVIK